MQVKFDAHAILHDYRLNRGYSSMPFKLLDLFKQGDLVYGLAQPRDKVLEVLTKEKYTHAYANALNDPAINLVMNNTSRSKAEKRLDEQQFKHFRFLRKHRAYLERTPGRPVPLMQDRPREGAAYRRSCKLLLINRDPHRKYKAHVLTSGLDWRRVCDKNKSGLGVTDSEIRAAFRDELRHGKNPNIFFYNQDLELLPAPPWQLPENKGIFKSYRAHVIAKDAKQNTPQKGF